MSDSKPNRFSQPCVNMGFWFFKFWFLTSDGQGPADHLRFGTTSGPRISEFKLRCQRHLNFKGTSIESLLSSWEYWKITLCRDGFSKWWHQNKIELGIASEYLIRLEINMQNTIFKSTHPQLMEHKLWSVTKFRAGVFHKWIVT